MEFTDETVAKYQNMVAGLAWCYTVDQHLHKDLMQEGFLGLHRACEAFDPSRGVMFSTYAHGKIRSKMQQYIQYKVNVVHVPKSKEDKPTYLMWGDCAEYSEDEYEVDFEHRDLMSIIRADIPDVVYQHFVMEVSVAELSRRKFGKCDYRHRKKINEEIADGLADLRTILGDE